MDLGSVAPVVRVDRLPHLGPPMRASRAHREALRDALLLLPPDRPVVSAEQKARRRGRDEDGGPARPTGHRRERHLAILRDHLYPHGVEQHERGEAENFRLTDKVSSVQNKSIKACMTGGGLFTHSTTLKSNVNIRILHAEFGAG